jgi:adenine specific DNA methylase Mod
MKLTTENTLYYGDNLNILRHKIPNESIDLIYLDPPFNSKADYNVLFREATGEKSHAQIQAFSDFWKWDAEARHAYEELTSGNPPNLQVANLTKALFNFLGRNDMMAYLVMMGVRLNELHRVLKPTGSLFLHCDSTASHYLKLMLDALFGGGISETKSSGRGSTSMLTRGGSEKSPTEYSSIQRMTITSLTDSGRR